ncbi:MAG: M20/M25/M40 family metallo-hydrolase [Clostridia bacterium]|nr:M20/M25/M40 family metallo-hydrolase [Clostridia bacterium]
MERNIEQRAFDYIDEHFDEAVSFWKALVEAESPFWNKAAVDSAVTKMAEFAESKGLFVKRRLCDTTGDGLIISYSEGEYRNGVTLMAHLDTVHEIGSFKPAVEIRDDWMYGAGAGDCKGGAVMALYTLLALRHSGYRARPVKLILVGNEEGGRPEAENYLPEELNGSAALFNCETGREKDIVTSRKASIGAVFTVRGTAGHIGNLDSAPKSAIRAAAEKILYLESLSDYENRTFVCGEVKGGSVFTSVPNECTFKVNCRIRSSKDIPWLKQTLKETSDREDVIGTSATLKLTGNIVPMSPSPANEELFQRFDAASRSLGYHGWNPVHSGGASDASYAVQLNIPAICATGVLAEGSHTHNERANIEDLRTRARIHIRTILELPKNFPLDAEK